MRSASTAPWYWRSLPTPTATVRIAAAGSVAAWLVTSAAFACASVHMVPDWLQPVAVAVVPLVKYQPLLPVAPAASASSLIHCSACLAAGAAGTYTIEV